MEILVKTGSKTVYRDGDVLVKQFDESYPKADVLNEALNNARVEDIGLCVPKILAVSCIDGKWSITKEYIEGKTLAQLMEEHPDKEDEFLSMFVNIQLEINSMKVPMLSRLRDKMQSRISASGYPQHVRYDLHMRVDGLPKHNKLCHGDLAPSNIIITPDGRHFVIDWTHATQGNASADTARAYLNFYIEGKEELAEKYLKLYCDKTGTDIRYIQNFLPIIAATYPKKHHEAEAEFLSRWVNVCDWQ
ncbi:MAG: aminoglycoside phosphotransferase family protein [Clostridia bacterium]|nr:aminoglycoside phosphotransferase family protein [Clostridia bacterium]